MHYGPRVAAIFDLDHTITRRDTYLHFLISYLFRHPEHMLRCMWLPFAVAVHKLKIRDNSWLKQMFLQAVAGGAERAELREWVQEFVERILAKEIRPGAMNTIRRHRSSGHHLLMATASLDFYVEELGRRLGFDAVICTRSAWDAKERLTGSLDGDNCYGTVKLELVNEYFGREPGQWYTLGYSDHHSDLPLLSWVDEAIAVNPSDKLFEIARRQGYEIQDWNAN